MEEKYQPKSFEERQEEIRKEIEDRNTRSKKVQMETMKWLDTNEKIQDYFKQFNPHSIQNFKEHYAFQKSLFMEYGEKFAEYSQNDSLKFRETAFDCLKLIQIKKLYDLRRQWGAELITIEGIDCGIDFFSASGDLLNCKLIPPISEEEFNLFMLYLKSPNYEITAQNLSYAGSNVSFIHVVAHTDDSELGEWFTFNNIHTGNGKYLLLPDIRGEKQMVYWKLARAEKDKEIEKKIETGELPKPQPMDKRPMLSGYDKKAFEAFLKMFEDADTIRKYEGFEAFQTKTKNETNSEDDDDDDEYINEQVERVIRDLDQLDFALPVKANKDWRKALIMAWNEYERQSIIDTMVPAYEDYLFRVKNGIAFEIEEEPDFIKSISTQSKEDILRGRELKNEPRNFDF